MMVKAMRRIKILIVCILLISSFFVINLNTVFADLIDGDYTYIVHNKESTITGYVGSGGAITIPSTIGGHPTIAIGANAFQNAISLISVIIPNSVRTIGNRTFQGCSSLTSVIIPGSVTNIGNYAFDSCPSLTTINVSSANLNYFSIDGVLYDKATMTLMQCPIRKAGSLIIPHKIITIGERACYLCQFLTSVTIPDGITTIGIRSFAGCSNLTEVIIPNSVIYINSVAFGSCSRLIYVIIGNNVTTIGDSAFVYCSSLPAITIPSSVTTIGNQTFKGCSSLSSINFQGLVAPTSVGEYWIDETSRKLTGHAYAMSNFPSPGNGWNGLIMGTELTHENEPPIASFIWLPSNTTVNNTITFDASASNDPDGTLSLYEWDWNTDGVYEESLSVPIVSHSWVKAGNYTITLRVTDDNGSTTTKTITVPVNSGSGNIDTNNKGTPGFELIIVIVAIALVFLLRRKSNK
jgi:hypothetical protein